MPYQAMPNAGQNLGQTRDQIRNNVQALKDSLAVNHVDLDSSPDTGKHFYVQLTDATSSIPATTSTELAIFNKQVGGTYRLYMRQISSGTQIQMSGIDPYISAPNGYTFLPGGLILAFGSETLGAGSGAYSVTFPNALTFSSNSYSVTT